MKGSKKLGAQLRRLRRESNLGLKSVAPLVDVSYTYISKVENGIKPPSDELVQKLCSVYGADVEALRAMQGRIPDDIAQLVADHGTEVFELIRTRYKPENSKPE